MREACPACGSHACLMTGFDFCRHTGTRREPVPGGPRSRSTVAQSPTPDGAPATTIRRRTTGRGKTTT